MKIRISQSAGLIFAMLAQHAAQGSCGPGKPPGGSCSTDALISDSSGYYYLFSGQQANITTEELEDVDCQCGQPEDDSINDPSGIKWVAENAVLSADSGSSITVGAASGTRESGKVTLQIDDAGNVYNDGEFKNVDELKFKFPRPRLQWVDFGGIVKPMKTDSGLEYSIDGAAAINTHHAQDKNNNGSFSDVGDHAYPVCYLKSTNVTISAKWVCAGVKPPEGTTFYVKMTGPDGISIPESANITATYTYANGEITISNVAAGKTPGNVSTTAGQAFTFSLGVDAPGGKYWFDAGVINNRLYTIMADPGTTALFESLVDISCSGAYNQSVTSNIFAGIWALFEKPDDALEIKRKAKDGKNNLDGTLLTYHKPADDSTNFTVSDLLGGSDGACQAWALLFRDLLKIQGVAVSPKVIKAQPLANPGGTPNNNSLLLIKTWSFNPFQRDDWSPGQGNRWPGKTNTFTNHAIIRYGGKIYDPSYGGPSHADTGGVLALGSWEAHALSGYAYVKPDRNADLVQEEPNIQTNENNLVE